MCAWASVNAGTTVRPPRSMTGVPVGASARSVFVSPIRAIRPWRKNTADAGRPPFTMDRILPLTRSRSAANFLPCLTGGRKRGVLRDSGFDGAPDGLEAFPKHLFGHVQWRQKANAVAEKTGADQQYAICDRASNDGQGVDRRERRLRFAISDKFDKHHRTQATHVTDKRPATLPAFQNFPHYIPQPIRMRQEFGRPDHLQSFDRRDAGQRATAIRAPDATQMRGIHDFSTPRYRADRHPGAQGLRGDDHIGHDAVMLHGKKAAGPPGPALHF